VVRILGAKGNLAGSSHSVGENVLGHTVGLYASAVYLVVPQNNLILTLFQLLGQGAIAYIHFMDIVYLTQSAETSKPTVRRQTTFQVCTIVYIDIFSSSEVAVIGFTYLGITVYSQNFISLTGHKSGGTIVTSLDLTSGTVANKALKEMKPS
jgi:hypothetical protein